MFKGGNILLYPDAQIRTAVLQSVAVEGPRGWRIAKEKAAHKIDVVVALSLACWGAVHEGPNGPVGEVTVHRRQDETGRVVPNIAELLVREGLGADLEYDPLSRMPGEPPGRRWPTSW